MRLLAALAALGIGFGLAANPGEVLVLAFPGLPTGSVTSESDLPLLLPPSSASGAPLAVVEVPPTLAPGIYRVCLKASGVQACKEVRVDPVRALGLRLDPETVFPQSLLTLENRGNLPLSIRIYPSPESEVPFDRQEFTLPPGVRRAVDLSPRHPGLLRAVVEEGEERGVYQVRVLPRPGTPLPYVLRGRAGLQLESLAQGQIQLEGPLSQDTFARIQGALPGGIWQGALERGAWKGQASLSPSALPAFRLAYRQPDSEVAVAYPLSLEARWTRGATYRAGFSPDLLSFDYRDDTYVLAARLPLGSPRDLSLRVEEYGTPFRFAGFERGAYLGEWQGPWRWQAGIGESGLSLDLGYWQELRPFLYGLEGRLTSGGLGAHLALGYRKEPFSLSLQGGVDPAGFTWSAGLAYAQGDYRAELTLGSSQARAALGWTDEAYSLSLQGSYGPDRALRLALQGALAFSLPVPESVSLALGGYEREPVEGTVTLAGKPVAGARVRTESGSTRTDEAGRFRLFLPKTDASVVAEAPGDLPALDAEARWQPGAGALALELKPAARVRLSCTGAGGAVLSGPTRLFLGCGESATLPPGEYRLLPQAAEGFRAEEATLRLGPLEEKDYPLAFRPDPRQALPPARPLRVDWPGAAAPGEVVRVRVYGTRQARILGVPLLVRKEFAEGVDLGFQIPWEARDSFAATLEAEGQVEQRILPLGDKPLLEIRLDPLRPRPGAELRVEVQALFPADSVRVFLGGFERTLERDPGGNPETPTFAARLKVDPEWVREAPALGPRRVLALRVLAEQGGYRVEQPLQVVVPAETAASGP